MKKNLLCFISVCTILFVQYVYAQQEQQPFTDIDKNNIYYDAIVYLKEKGVVEGYEDGSFKPNQKINRAEALKIVLLGSKKTITEEWNLPFPDAAHEAWYVPYIATGMQLGIVQGYPDGYFRPEKNVNKVESLKIILHTNEILLSGERLQQSFDDVPSLSSPTWYEPYVVYGIKTNIVEPVTVKMFVPQKEMTRGDVATIMYRLAYIQERNQTSFDTSQQGQASFYGASFDGRKTASGKTFFNNSFLAAHRYLPFNTFVQVVNRNTGIATIATIVDRGPYIDGRIIDLAQSAFSSIESLSRGIASVQINPIGVISDVSKSFIEKNAFYDETESTAGVLLDNTIPNLFLQNEVYTITGKVSSMATTVTAIITSKETKKQYTFTTKVMNQQFSLPLILPMEGAYTLNIIPDSMGMGYEDIYVVKDSYFDRLSYITTSNSPQSLKITSENEKTVLSWDGNGNNVFKIHFLQGDKEKIWYVNNAQKFEIPYNEFLDFSAGQIRVVVEGAKKSTIFSCDRYTTWSTSSEIVFNAVIHEFEIYNKDKILLSSFSPFIQNSSIVLTGVAKTTLEPDVWYTLPSGKTGTTSCSHKEIITLGEALSCTIPIVENGTYIIEINDTNGEAVFNYPFYTVGAIPFIPNMRDLEQYAEIVSNISLQQEQQKMVKEMNIIRKQLSIEPLTIQTSLNNLAQARSNDMAVRGYFSHITPEGKSVKDMMSEYSITGSIGENLAKDNNMVLGLYGLLRSPIHRNIIINPLFRSVGFGFTKFSDGQWGIVQVFN